MNKLSHLEARTKSLKESGRQMKTLVLTLIGLGAGFFVALTLLVQERALPEDPAMVSSDTPLSFTASGGDGGPSASLLQRAQEGQDREEARVLVTSADVFSPDGNSCEALEEPERALFGPDLWAEKYKGATDGQLSEKLRNLMLTLDESTRDYYRQCFDSGRYESYDVEKNEQGGYDLTFLMDGYLRETKFQPGGQVLSVRLPREQFAEAYRLRDEISWLEERAVLLGRKRPVASRKE